jgi:hypothetical protein
MTERIFLCGPSGCGKTATARNLMVEGDVLFTNEKELALVRARPGSIVYFETNLGADHWSTKGRVYCTYFDKIYHWTSTDPADAPTVISKTRPEDREKWLSFWGIATQ